MDRSCVSRVLVTIMTLWCPLGGRFQPWWSPSLSRGPPPPQLNPTETAPGLRHSGVGVGVGVCGRGSSRNLSSLLLQMIRANRTQKESFGREL